MFSEAAQSLHDSLIDEKDPAWLTVLIVEASRIVDRLEKLNGLLSGDIQTWLHLDLGRDSVIEVRVDDALKEARSQMATLGRVLNQIRAAKAAKPGDGAKRADVLAGL